ncbi:MAG: DUF1697 domain-containing protein [Myxococcales bacterium]|jgi:uncharacterized protein (DUF1697 family)
MAVYVALCRALNVGGTGKLPMKQLSSLCAQLGFEDVCTYIQSGNVVFRSRRGAPRVKGELETALTERLGRPTRVLVRTASELAAAVKNNPFPAGVALTTSRRPRRPFVGGDPG